MTTADSGAGSRGAPRTPHFLTSSAAERYAAGRPYLHPRIVERITRGTGVARFGTVLDVGCGTGQSTRAIADVAGEVIGVDLSEEMLRCAVPHERVRYLAARAESLPVTPKTFDLVTVGLAFHWFDRERFLAEVSRVLVPGGWLAIYNNWFTGRVAGVPEFETWSRDVYLARYPSPPRRSTPLETKTLARAGFFEQSHERFELAVPMATASLVAFLLSQSNIAAAVERGDETLSGIETWLSREVGRQLTDGPYEALFGVDLTLFRREA